MAELKDTPVAIWAALLLVLVLLGVVIFDLVAIYTGGRWLTVSAVLQAWSRAYPVLPFLLGLLVAHLLLPWSQ